MMIRLVLTSLAAILAGSAAQAQVGMRSPGAGASMGHAGCPSGSGGTSSAAIAGSNFAIGRSAMLGGGSSLGLNSSATNGMSNAALATGSYGGYNNYGGYNAAQSGSGAGYTTNYAATNGFYGGNNNMAGGYDTSPWGNMPATGGSASAASNNGVGTMSTADMNAHQYAAYNLNSSGDNPGGGTMVAAGVAKASTERVFQSKTKAKKSKVKTKAMSTTAKSKSS